MITGKKLLEFYILWTTKKGPKCGYDIMKELEEFFELKKLSHAVLYLTLRNLESKKYLVGAKGSRNKTIYSLTEKGMGKLDSEMLSMRRYLLKFKDILDEILSTESGVEQNG
ncbi:MAG: PadR family transcriptional regulator [Candidatus Methanofastidiosa archaeon]|nr:PadR family transcriptional regulator [Candidatus Methanofastidiosa archaeon]